MRLLDSGFRRNDGSDGSIALSRSSYDSEYDLNPTAGPADQSLWRRFNPSPLSLPNPTFVGRLEP